MSGPTVSRQHHEVVADRVRQEFERLLTAEPARFERRIDLSWSNWGFGVEPLEDGVQRLRRSGLEHIELHGNLYGPDLGYRADAVLAVLADSGMHVSGVCGMFSTDNELASPTPSQRQRAVDYIRRQTDFTTAVGGAYLLVVPAAVGRPVAYDSEEWGRSVDTLRRVADVFVESGVKAAIEPIRADETTLVHTVSDALEYIAAVDHPGVQHINGDLFHMQAGEGNIAEAVLQAGDRLINLHVADSNRRALGSGSMDLDTIIRALYLIGQNREGRYVTAEPLGPGASPYASMWGRSDPAELDALVSETVSYFRERELAVLGGGEAI